MSDKEHTGDPTETPSNAGAAEGEQGRDLHGAAREVHDAEDQQDTETPGGG